MDLMQGLYLRRKLELVVTSEVSNVHLSAKIRRLAVWFLVMNISLDPCYRPFPRRGAMTKADSGKRLCQARETGSAAAATSTRADRQDLFLITSTPGLHQKMRAIRGLGGMATVSGG